jgi:hypothetical protein
LGAAFFFASCGAFMRGECIQAWNDGTLWLMSAKSARAIR